MTNRRNVEMGQFLVLNLTIDSISIDYGQVFIPNSHLMKKFYPWNLPLLLAFFSIFPVTMTLAPNLALMRDYSVLKRDETYAHMFLACISFSLGVIFREKFFLISLDPTTHIPHVFFSLFHHCPCPPARDLDGRVSGLVSHSFGRLRGFPQFLWRID